MDRKKRTFRKAQVFGKVIPIRKVEGLLDDHDHFGHFDLDKKEICVDRSLRGKELEHTVIHELFHATLDRLHIQQQISKIFAEVIIENLATAVIENFDVRWKK